MAFGLIALMGLVAVYVHAWLLPKHGINGWTAEPYDKCLELVAPARDTTPTPYYFGR